MPFFGSHVPINANRGRYRGYHEVEVAVVV
jgi:hypothetical protein